MKKLILILLLILFLGNVLGKASSDIMIPENAIRYRVIANSDSTEDQQLKYQVRDALDKVIHPILLKSRTKEETKKNLLENTHLMNQTVAQVLKENQQNMD